MRTEAPRTPLEVLASNRGNAKTGGENNATRSTFQIDYFTCSKTHTWGCELCVFNNRVRQDDRRDSILRSRRKFVTSAFSHRNNVEMQGDTAFVHAGSGLTSPIRHKLAEVCLKPREQVLFSGGDHACPPEVDRRLTLR